MHASVKYRSATVIAASTCLQLAFFSATAMLHLLLQYQVDAFK
jgi:hypothetical protein